MKNYLRLFTFLFFVLLLQTAIAQHTYKLNIGIDKSVDLINSYPMANGDYIVAGRESPLTTESKLRLVRLKSDGSVMWSKNFSVPGYITYAAIISPTADNGFIAAARIDSVHRHGVGIVLFKCDSSGNIQWTKKMTVEKRSYLSCEKIIQTKDGGFYLVHDDISLTYIDRFDSGGNLLWYRTFNLNYNGYGYGVDRIAEAADGGVLLSVYIIGCDIYCIEYSLLKFKKNGDPESMLSFTQDFTYASSAYYLDEDSTGIIHILFRSKILSRTIDNGRFSYLTIHPNEVMLQVLSIKDDVFSLQHFFRTNRIIPVNGTLYTDDDEPCITINKDQSMNIVSDSTRTNHKSYIHVEKYDSLGRICPDFILPAIDTAIQHTSIHLYREDLHIEQAPRLIFTPAEVISSAAGDTYMLCNSTAPSDVPVTKNMLAANSRNKPFNITAYPNPVQHNIYVATGINRSGPAQIQIRSTDGKIRKLFSEFLPAGTSTKVYDVSRLAKGMYLLTITTGANQQTLKFIKE